ncbi:hypothetical protein G6K91_31960 [Agrobacterium rhizogenes]|nr:hypothetical protein [Rhizobium rhizogenes]NTG58013.1 hypothetical protein [Rhizobium rhizogenes]
MKPTIIAFIVALLPPALAHAGTANFNAEKPAASHGFPTNDVFDEDLSCKDINQAAMKTWDSPQVAVITYNAKTDGTLKAHSELRVVGPREFEKFTFSKKWRTYWRGSVAIVGQRGPFWNSCKFIGAENEGQRAQLHYSAVWRSFPYEAAADIWISAVDGRFQKIQSRFPDKLWKFPFATALDVFSYDPAQIEVPLVDGK